MLERAKRPSWSEQSQATVRDPAPELRSAEPAAAEPEETASELARGGVLVQPLVLAALTLIVAGVVWAAVRGLEFHGFSPLHLVYDLDQPPLLLIVVAAWLLYRSRRR
jgi:hypothetical protein